MVEQIDFHPIPTCPLYDILHNPEKIAFNINSTPLLPGQLRIDTSKEGIVGVGSFKTAQLAELTLSSPPHSGLGSKSPHSVIIKRPYIMRRKENIERDENAEEEIQGPPYLRYTLAENLQKLHREANVLYWAKALLTLTYDFVDRAISKSTQPPPFNIPHLRFVDAGLALGYSATNKGIRGPRAGMVNSVYLVEEEIPASKAEFIKFIHNGNCSPILPPGVPGHNIALFLAFTQHVQYFKTGGLAYISDYQGVTTMFLLSLSLTLTFWCRKYGAAYRPPNSDAPVST
jgi:hypothetical protein